MKQLILFALLACLVATSVAAREPAIDVTEPQTIDVWEVLIRGKLNRSEVVQLVGKPDVSMTGALTFNNRVKNADTDDVHALNVMFTNGERMPATYVGHLPNHNAGNPPPFTK